MGLPFLQGSLISDTPEEAVARIEEIVLKKKPKPDEIRELVEALKNADTNIRVKERAAWALGELDAKSAVAPLIEAAKHKGLLVRSAALNALIQLRAKSALATMTEIAESDPILSLRQNATLGLGLIQTDKAINPLVKLSEDPNPEIRGASVLSMASLHSKKNSFSEVLKDMSADTSPYVQERVKKGFDVTKRNNKSVLTHLETQDTDIRLFAALYFQQHGGSKDLKSLEKFFSSEADEEVRKELKKSIAAIKRRSAAATAKAKPKTAPAK